MIKKLGVKLGIDKAILYASSAKISQGIGGIVSVLMVARFLSGAEQGFYYTFASLLAIQVFFELGLNGIVTQYVAHEAVHLTLKGNHYFGDDKYLSRLASLLHFCSNWYLVLSAIFLIALIAIGFIFFGLFYKSDVHIVWHFPWVLISISTVLAFIVSPILAYIEGLGNVKQVAKIRLFQNLIYLTVLWVMLFAGLKLYVAGIASICGILFVVYTIYKQYGALLSNISRIKVVEKVNYRIEIFPFQWKITLSAMSGYLIFQLFNPVLFATSGPIVAGQMGMTISVLNAVLFLTFGWVATKVPVFSGLIANKDYRTLDTIFKRTFWSSSIVNFLGLVIVLVVMIAIRHFDISILGSSLADRFLPIVPMIFMSIPILLNHMISAMATYLRCHKKEPMLVQSIVIGLLCATSTLLFGRLYGVIGITASYMIITILGFVWTCIIFNTKRIQWHNE